MLIVCSSLYKTDFANFSLNRSYKATPICVPARIINWYRTLSFIIDPWNFLIIGIKMVTCFLNIRIICVFDIDLTYDVPWKDSSTLMGTMTYLARGVPLFLIF